MPAHASWPTTSWGPNHRPNAGDRVWVWRPNHPYPRLYRIDRHGFIYIGVDENPA